MAKTKTAGKVTLDPSNVVSLFEAETAARIQGITVGPVIGQRYCFFAATHYYIGTLWAENPDWYLIGDDAQMVFETGTLKDLETNGKASNSERCTGGEAHIAKRWIVAVTPL